MKTHKILVVLLLTFNSMTHVFSQDVVARTSKLDVDFTPSTDVIVWITPSLEINVSESKKLDIKIGFNSDVPIEKVAIYLNGSPQANNRGFMLRKSDDENFDSILEHSLSLADDENIIRVIAEDAEGVRTVNTRVIRVLDGGLSIVKNRMNYALLFATNDYEEWGDLVNPIDDAREIGIELKDNYEFEVELIENASKSEILSKIREYAEKSYLKYDQLVIFFAGHGHYDETNGEGYIVAKDSKIIGDENFESYLSQIQLRTRFDNIGAEHLFVIMDACFAGSFDPAISQSTSRGGNPMYDDNTILERVAKKLQNRTRQFLTSGGKEYVSDGIPGRNSPFAYRLLEALRGDGGGDGLVTIGDINEFVSLITSPEPRQGPFGSNEAGSDFVFERKN